MKRLRTVLFWTHLFAGVTAGLIILVMSFTGASGYQYAVAVTADGHTLLAAGSDGVLRLWFGRDPRVKHSLAP